MDNKLKSDKITVIDEIGRPINIPKSMTSEKLRDQQINKIQIKTLSKKEEEIFNSPFEVIDNLQVSLRRFYSLNNMDILKSGENEKVNVTVEVIGFAKLVQTICQEDADLALGSIMIANSELYTVKHTIHTAIVCEIISKYLGWASTDRLLLLAAAFTMNIAMIELQDKLHFQEEPLSPEQKSAIRGHPQKGVELLIRNGVNNKIWLNIVAQHHESPDGSGYPLGLKGEQISLSAKIISLADQFCAKVVGRDYRRPLVPNAAMQSVFLSSKAKIDNDFAMMFVKVLGIYPPGTLVRLANKEIAIVTHRGEKVNEPMASPLLKPDGSLASSSCQRDCSDPKFAVKEVIPWAEANVKINRYQLWGYGEYKRAREIKKCAPKQIRSERRLNTMIPVIIIRFKDNTPTKGMIVDLTTKGCLLKVPKDAANPEQILSKILLSFKLGDKVIKNLKCQIKNVKEDIDNNLLGIQFQDIEPESSSILSNYIEDIRKKQA